METSSPLYNLDYFGETMEQKDRSSHGFSGKWENISFLSPFTVSLFITSPCTLAYFVWLFGENFQETEKKLKYFGARMFWINFVPRIPSSRRCVLIKVYFLRSVWHLKRIFRKSAISQCIWPLSLVFTFFFMKENRRAFSEWMESFTLL